MLNLLHHMVKQKASDLHIKAGSAPGFRIDGNVVQQAEYGTLSPDQTRALAAEVMSPEQRQKFEAEKDFDFSYAVKDLARFRVNVLVQRGSVGMVIRQIPDRIPTVDELGLPQICRDLAMKPRGLVLVTGPTGSGKSTTLAAMIDFYNANEQGHILTMEDPIEFIHKDKKCFVNQRQIGQDTLSFSQALRRALRQDPDVILIGEMRDRETIGMAITAAETGHLVFGTLHTTSAISTVDRIIDVFPHEAQQQIRVQLATTLQGVISQTLLPKAGGGRCAAREILVASDGVRSLIREGKTPQILNLMQTGGKLGMSTLEMELTAFVQKGLVSLEDAMSRANRPDEVQRNIAAGGGVRAAAAPAAHAAMAGSGNGSGMGQGARPGMAAAGRPRL